MTQDRLFQLLQQKESQHLEFKEATYSLPDNLFETICAMLNGDGGDILLGVNDSAKITGIDASQLNKMMDDLASLSNNPTKISPAFLLFPRQHHVADKWLIHLHVPASSLIHRCSKTIYVRSSDGDFRVTEASQIAEIFNRKRIHYTESSVFPAFRFEDFNAALFPKLRNLIRSNNADHPWLALDNKQLLETAGLWKRDFLNGQEGYTLAAALLLGKDEVITQILPHFKIDAIIRIRDTNRYDDRLYIQTNLIDAYEQLMGFVEKHLPDKFFLLRDQRISLRTSIFREIVANIIVHREYTNAQPCIFVIGKNYVETENANNPHGEGLINPDRFAPFPKNPTIAKFFIQLGRVDELGSGVLNVTRLTKQYAGKRKPEFTEGITFRAKIPIPIIKSDGASDGVNDGTIEGENDFLRIPNAVSNTLSNARYNPRGNPIFCKGQLVPTLLIELVDRLIENSIINGELDELTNTGRIELIQIVFIVLDKAGQKAHEIASILQRSRPTIERQMKRAKALNIVRFLGPTKTGGYYITEYFENRLVKND